MGILETGLHNAITDVEGIRVGHSQSQAGEASGVTVIEPPRLPARAGTAVVNGTGVLTASLENATRAAVELPVGTVKVNGVFGGAPGGAAQPRGISGSGFGYGPELLDELTLTKVVHLGSAVTDGAA